MKTGNDRPYHFRRADGVLFTAEAVDDTAELLNRAEMACGIEEWDANSRTTPTQDWEDATGLLHCARCGALCFNLYGGGAECAVCFELGEERQS